MVKKKNSVNETSTIIIDDEAALTEIEEAQEFADLYATLQEVRKSEGVTGYVLKSDTEATVDIEDPAKLVEYALLSSQAFDSSEELKTQLNLGEIESILVEGKNTKILCLTIGNNTLSVFMEKNANNIEILNRIRPRTE
jgi:predicted regulator of Ras-like GTPase activity (Roadblock/LC7/MglB family)